MFVGIDFCNEISYVHTVRLYVIHIDEHIR